MPSCELYNFSSFFSYEDSIKLLLTKAVRCLSAVRLRVSIFVWISDTNSSSAAQYWKFEHVPSSCWEYQGTLLPLWREHSKLSTKPCCCLRIAFFITPDLTVLVILLNIIIIFKPWKAVSVILKTNLFFLNEYCSIFNFILPLENSDFNRHSHGNPNLPASDRM